MTRYVTGRLLAASVLTVTGALLAVLLGMPEVALFVAPWAVLLVLGLRASEDELDVRVHVHASDDRLVVGDEFNVTTTIASSAPVSARVIPVASSAFSPADTVVDLVHANGTINVESSVIAQEWGAHDVGAVQVHLRPPYGLVEVRGSAAARRMVRVHPSPTQLRELVAPFRVRRVSGTHRSRESSRGVEYADVRQFAAGDSVRDINWRASARSRELWVSQRHPDRATDVVLLVDSFVESGHDIRKVFGLVVESALAVAESHLAATDRVGLIEFGGVVRWVSPSTGSVQLQQLADALLSTGLYENAAEKDLPILPPRALPARSFVIAFTPLLDQRFIDAIYAARTRGHDVVVVECLAPLPDLAEDASDAARVSQRIHQAERAMLRDQLSEQGIAVAPWDGDEHLDVALGELVRRRLRSAGMAAR